MFLENLTTDIHYFTNDSKCENKIIKNCTILNEFIFSRIEFILAKKVLNYYICISKDGEIYSLKDYKILNDNGIENTPSEIMSLFRKGFTKNSITEEMIDIFVKHPKKFRKKYISNQNVK